MPGPRNHFPLAAAPAYLFIAGGVGITPLLPMLREADHAGADWRLVYCGRRRQSMAFADEVSAFGEQGRVPARETDGPLDLRVLLERPAPDTLVYCCGPERLIEAVEDKCAS